MPHSEEHLCVTLVPLFNHLDLTDQKKINAIVTHQQYEKGAQMEINANKMIGVEQQTQFLLMEKVEERLAKYLLDLHKATGNDQVEIPMKMKELAAYLGTTPETLSRKFALLEDKQWLQRQGKQVTLLAIEKLEEL